VNEIPSFGTADRVAVTILVDNQANLIVKSTDNIVYFTKKPLLAEHGFAALIDVNDGERRILWDAGISRRALMENAARMEVDFTTIDAIVLSHGHGDHTGAVADVLDVVGRRNREREWPAGTAMADVDAWLDTQRLPIVLHPAALRELWGKDDEGKLHGPGLPPPTGTWEDLGAKIVCEEGPYRLADGFWTTGYVPRRSFEHSGRGTSTYYRDGDVLRRHDTEDDQALILNVAGKGLVVVSGCAHAGIVNTVRHAQEITGVDRVHAVIGGFHLARCEPDELEQTIAAFKGWAPTLISPSHCTGFGPICRFAAEMPGPFVPGVVGVTYRF